jgi:hypothetical protein
VKLTLTGLVVTLNMELEWSLEQMRQQIVVTGGGLLKIPPHNFNPLTAKPRLRISS